VVATAAVTKMGKRLGKQIKRTKKVRARYRDKQIDTVAEMWARLRRVRGKEPPE